jgi:hypothetical protein
MRYLFKQSTIPIHTPGTMPTIPCSNPRLYYANNHQPNHTPGTFPNHPQSHSIHEVPFQAIHNPILHARYRPHPKPYFGHLSKPSTIPIRTRGTFPSHPQAHAVHRVPTIAYSVLRAPVQSNHHPIPYTRYLANLSTVPIRMLGTRPNHYSSTHVS